MQQPRPFPWKPALQVVHVTDLHVKDINSSDAALLNWEWTVLIKRKLRRWIKKHNAFGWIEGTQGHLWEAPEAFTAFLEEFKRTRPEWFAPGDARPATWLVHTGDLTAFGDEGAIDLANAYLRRWSDALEIGPEQTRSLFGNHDAWAGCHPAWSLLGSAELDDAQQRLKQRPEWNRDIWIDNPLVAKLPGGQAHIELYALNSVYWEPLFNVLAVGFVDREDLGHLKDKATYNASGQSLSRLRLLATHHPVVYPWCQQEVRGPCAAQMMKLLSSDATIDHVNNDIGRSDIGPLAHLILSGHTHGTWPCSLPESPGTLRQGGLGPYQLQLVTGALMLNGAPLAAPRSTPVVDAEAFSDVSVDCTSCRAQILQFYYTPDRPEEVLMYRIPVFSSSSGKKYHTGEEKGVNKVAGADWPATRTLLYMRAPRPVP